jgi:hypothetical protein
MPEMHMVAAMTEKQIKKALRELKALDVDEYRRIVIGAVIQIQVRLRAEGEDAEVEFGGDAHRQ